MLRVPSKTGRRDDQVSRVSPADTSNIVFTRWLAEFPAFPDETGKFADFALEPCFRREDGGPNQPVASKFPLPPETGIFTAYPGIIRENLKEE